MKKNSRFSKRSTHHHNNSGSIVGKLMLGAAALGGTLFLIRSWPEIHRYLRIKRM